MTGRTGCWLLALLVLLPIAWFLFGMGINTNYAFNDQLVRLPNGAIITVSPRQNWNERGGWLSTSTMEDETAFAVFYSPDLAKRYQVFLVNSGRRIPVPFACDQSSCGGYVKGAQPVAGRDVRLCVKPKTIGNERCAALKFTYGKSVALTRWIAMMSI